MFKHFYAMFYKPSTTPNYKHVVRNFHRVKKKQPSVKIKYLMPAAFEASSTERAFVWRFFLNKCVQISAGK